MLRPGIKTLTQETPNWSRDLSTRSLGFHNHIDTIHRGNLDYA